MKRYKYLAKFYFTTQFHFQEFEFHSVGVWGFVSNTRYKKAQTISELSGVSYVLPFSLLVGVQELAGTFRYFLHISTACKCHVHVCFIFII